MKTPSDLSFVMKTGQMKVIDYLHLHYPEFLSFLTASFPECSDISEKLYMYYNGMNSIPKCPICGRNNKFINFSRGFTKHCSPACTQNDSIVVDKRKETNKNRYGCDWQHTIYEKGKKTKKQKYNNENYNNSEANKKTCLERYGVDNPMKCQKFKNKSKQTCLKKYGTEYFLSSNEFLENKNKHIVKAKQSCLDRYGAESPMKIDEIKRKVNNTCLNKYGVLWNCMRKEAHNSRNANSYPNKFFEKLLNANNIEYEKEFVVNNFTYDFKIGNILLEINPSATHNINFNPFSKTKVIDYKYHLNKLQNAETAGYRCICVFDWDEPEKIIQLINSDRTQIYARKCEIHEVKKTDAKKFLIENHLQGACRGQKICLGLYFNNELVQIMTFGKPRYNKEYEYELLRLCSKTGFNIIGGTSKLFRYFVKKYAPKTIISYCDRSKFTGEIYEILGFEKQKDNPPSCHWVNLKTNQVINNSMLLKLGYDKIFNTDYGKHTSNNELMLKNKFVQVFDCGQAAYVWKSL